MVINQLPKFTSNAIVNVSDLLTKRGSEVSAIRRTIPDYSIALQWLVGRRCHRARKPPADICCQRVCIGWQQFFLVAQYLRDHPFGLRCVDLNVCQDFLSPLAAQPASAKPSSRRGRIELMCPCRETIAGNILRQLPQGSRFGLSLHSPLSHRLGCSAAQNHKFRLNSLASVAT